MLCGAVNGPYICDLDRGHEGPHVAHGSKAAGKDGVVLSTWGQTALPSFNLAEGQRRKVEGQELVASNEPDFNAALDAIIDRLAAESFKTGVPFHADDVRRMASQYPDFPEPRSDRSWGSRYGTAARLGIIRPSGDTRASEYVVNHGGRTILWIGTGRTREGARRRR